MTSIYLIRHGQASFGQQNYDQLSPLGKQQSRRLGESLQQRLGHFDRVCLGSMFRHRQTAAECLEAMGQDTPDGEWDCNSGWNEYDHQNILAQLNPEFATVSGIQAYVSQQADTKHAFEKLFNDAISRWMSGEYDGEYSEAWPVYQKRIKQALAKTIEKNPNAEKIAVFTSGGAISVISQYLLGVAPEHFMKLNWTLLNCGVTKLVTTGSRLFVASLNEHTHFEGQHQSLISYK
ncbi:histidine phosphatase family protein [Agarilytica rhodophyticola]|uniref:histidine phosphatase family protein n=1 Tax=Agarilytica rhodophyticola TaxID=1737490 RepID=UPI000B345AAD|nr:histidine phosphatase family protein [Agarilytica rhodophyticola]